MSPTAQLEYAENPYRPTPTTAPDFPGYSASDEIAELCAYVGPRRAYYLRKWAAKLEDPQGDVGINWVAFFFPSVWLAYRKMYVPFLIYCGVMFLLGVGKEALFIFALHQPQAPLLVNLIVNILSGLVCALYGNAWYLSQARSTIATLRSRGYQGEELLYALSKRGGTSILAVFVANIGAGLILGIVLVLLIGVGIALHGL